jgi:hypothetical protein
MIDLPAFAWRKSSHSGDQGECVEVAGLAAGSIAVRDSKDPDGPRLLLTPGDFRALVRAAKKGALEF